MTQTAAEREMDRVSMVRSNPKLKKVKHASRSKKELYPGCTPLYVVLPNSQIAWIKKEAKAQNRTVRAIMNMMVDAAHKGYVFEKETK